MKKGLLTITLAVLALAADAAAQTAAAPAPQQPAAAASKDGSVTANNVLGDVVEIDAAKKVAVIRINATQVVAAALADSTAYFRAKPEALARAESGKITPADLDKIALADVGVGDRVVVLGRVSDDKQAVLARILIVAKKADIAGKQDRDREEWRRRGTLGVVSAVNPATKEITISTRTPEGQKPLVVEAGGERVSFRRYPAGSVKYADARPSAFADVRVGDQLRALGAKNADGSRFTPEIVAFGSFRTLLGKVVSVDVANKTVKINDEQNKRVLDVSLVADSHVRRLPEMMGMMMARLAGGGAMGGGRFGGGQGGGGGGRQGGARGGGGGGGQTPAGAQPQQGGEGQGGSGQRRMMGGGGGGFDIQEMIERLPQVQLSELKPGDVVIMSSTVGSDPSRATAITILAGAEPILLAMRSGGARQAGAGASTSSGLPPGLELGIGIP